MRFTCPIHGSISLSRDLWGRHGCPKCLVGNSSNCDDRSSPDQERWKNIQFKNISENEKWGSDYTGKPHSDETRMKLSQRFLHTAEQTITDFKIKHRDKYDYSKVVYRGSTEKIIVTCKIHGDFETTPARHKQKGCPICLRIQKKCLAVEVNNKANLPFVSQQKFKVEVGKNYLSSTEISYVEIPKSETTEELLQYYTKDENWQFVLNEFGFGSPEWESYLKKMEEHTGFTVIRCPKHGIMSAQVGIYVEFNDCEECYMESEIL